MILSADRIDKIVSPLHVQSRFREQRNEAALGKILSHQDASPRATPSPRMAAAASFLFGDALSLTFAAGVALILSGLALAVSNTRTGPRKVVTRQ
ncbi:UNVERIFIED_ORG: hypothetical protein GGD59_005358 [Rhizobium esperanzae]|uniref:hypothetical protein n=1 Tax=Rhizobium phaseoli TaxID=396 RepID=UPI0017E8279B